MKFTTLLSPDDIRQGVAFSSKKRLFESIATFVVENFTLKMVNKLVLNVYLNEKN